LQGIARLDRFAHIACAKLSVMPKFDWHGLRFFLAAARERSLVGAGRVLGVKHTTVGRRLDDIESALKAKLFLRTTEGLQLTELGETVLPLAEEMERAASRVLESARADH